MFGSTVLEVAIGLTFCYAALALIVSTVQEALASALRLRARVLLDGVKSMLNDPGFDALARAVYAHALVNPHDDGKALDQRRLKAKPSYIEPAHFAIALLDAIQSIPGDFAQLGRDIDALPDAQLRRALQGIYQRADGDLEGVRVQLAGWFGSAMARVSGAYKRRAQLVSLLLALLLAVLFNIDSIHLFRTLWQHPGLAAQLGALPTLDPRTFDALWTLPLGWRSFPPRLDAAFVLSVAGWTITATTALFGAPFWFDLMQRAVQMRGTGAKPKS
ncbi:MAG TPA: hypothetical protein VFG03_19050 [Telluria sp.]|nr:hypothetical protein [Telluria sp.]